MNTRYGSRLAAALALTTSLFIARPIAAAVDSTFAVSGTMHQVIDGFGAAEHSMGDLWGNGNYRDQGPGIDKTAGTLTKGTQIFDKLFDPVNGAGLSILRVPIPSKDAETSKPSAVAPYDYTTDTIYAAAWTLKEAKGRGVRRFYTIPWSPPAWMKTNGRFGLPPGSTDAFYNANVSGGISAADLQNNVLDPSHETDMVDYLRDWVISFQKLYGINYGWLGVNNEMNFVTTWESSYYTPARIRDFLGGTNRLIAGFSAYNLGTEITACETSNLRKLTSPLTTYTASDYVNTVLQNATNSANIHFATTHYYSGTGGYDTDLNVASPPGVWRKWQTEITNKNNPDDWTDAEQWAVDIHNFLTVGEYSAWLYWRCCNPFGNSDAQSLIYADASGNITYHRRLYAIGQFAREIRPGFRRTDCSLTSGNNLVLASAYKNPANGKRVIVLINTDSAGRSVNLTGLGTATFKVCRSGQGGDSFNMLTNLTASGGTLSIPAATFPTHSMLTLSEVVTDTTKPGSTALTLSHGTGTNVVAQWQAPGDDAYTFGTTATYDIRYSSSAITTQTAWNNATKLDDSGKGAAPAPREAGYQHKTVIYGLANGTWHIALRAVDNAGNMSDLAADTSISVP